MFLIDTNCWIQLVRQRAQADDVRRFLAAVPADQLATTDYTVHGVGIIMGRHGVIGDYAAFLGRLSIGTAVRVVGVAVADLGRVADASLTHQLDFDDAYQYAAAELHGLSMVSLDADFDRTPRGRLTPAAALAKYTADRHQQQK